jgi:hypothetical protein
MEHSIVKTYPRRGPLHQHRLASATQFECFRCGQQKTSKLLTVVEDDWNRLICNGCYGRLLSIWEIKTGALPDDARDRALLQALTASVSPEEIARTRSHLQREQAGYPQLSETAQLMIATSHAVKGALQSATGLDWSAAVIGLCKAVEVEVMRAVVEPLRAAVAGIDIDADVQDKDLGRVARYCAGLAPPPELGSLIHFIGTAAHSKRRAAASALIKSLHQLAAQWPDGGEWILDTDGFLASATRLTQEFRNPAAHTELLDVDHFYACSRLVEAHGGLLHRLLETTRTA